MSAEPTQATTATGTLGEVEKQVRFNGVSPADLFLDRLTDVGSETWGPDSSGERTSNCPAHDDGRASLRWTVSSSGVVKFHCLAGCDFQEVLKALSLRGFDMKWASVDYAYEDLDFETGEIRYLFDVRRYNKADAQGKQYVQFRREAIPPEQEERLGKGFTETPGNGLEGRDNGPLWLWPLLVEKAEDARAAGRQLELVVVEGEKDAHAIWRSGAVGPWDFVTTSAGGAGGWRDRHTQDIVMLAQKGLLGKIVVICDPDKAGKARGPVIVSALESALEGLGGAASDVAVHAVTTDGTDVSDLADQKGARFWEHLVGMDAVEMASSMEEGTVISGYVTRVGQPGIPGRKAMAMPKSDDEFQIVLSGELRPVAVWETGWQVDVVGPTGPARRTLLEKADLITKQAFDKWLIHNNLAVPPTCKVPGAMICQGLAVWLTWYCQTDPTVKKMKTTPYLTWVNPLTGDPAKEPGREGAVWISGDEEADAENGFIWTGTDLLGRWDKEHTELDCAWAWAQALTFGDERTVAAVGGWAAATLVAPWLAKWSDTKPGLAIIAVSSSGKTHGASRMLLQLAGCRGNFTGSAAAIRRQFSAGGISTIRWIDDASNALLENSGFKETLRITTSQSEHSLSTPDDGTTATHSSKMTGSVVVSAEGVSWMKETAMLDRFLLVQPDKPTGRTSYRADREGERQWYDVLELQDLWGKDWAAMAGWSVEGMRRVIGPNGELLRGIVEEVGRPGDRGDIGAWYAAVGARLLRRWLSEAQEEARGAARSLGEGSGAEGWPGDREEWHGESPLGHDRTRVRQWDWLVEMADRRLDEERVNAGARYGSLVTQVLPLLFTRAAATEKSQWKTPMYLEVPCGCEGAERWEAKGVTMPEGWIENGEPIKTSLRMHAEEKVGGIVVGLPPVLVEECGAIWVDTKALAAWYQTDPLGRNGEERVVGAQALTDQAKAIDDTPSWAFWKRHVGGGRNPIVRNELQVKTGRGDSGSVRYVRLSHEASEAAQHG